MNRIDKYEILEVAGSGGMGTVYKAFHPHFKKYVALKEIHPELAQEADARRRFQQEVHILAHLPSHPHIVTVRDAFEWEGRLFLVMDFIDGFSLRRLIEKGPLEPQRVAQMLDQILSGLEVTHRAGVIHRDLKAENILIDREGMAYLTDFGIAEILGDDSDGPLMGTARYTAPELINPEKYGRDAEPTQADLYALGILAFELAVGKEQFNELFRSVFRGNPHEIGKRWLAWHTDLGKVAPLLHEVNSKIPDYLSRTIERLMAKNTKDRYRSASQARADLIPELSGRNRNTPDSRRRIAFQASHDPVENDDTQPIPVQQARSRHSVASERVYSKPASKKRATKRWSLPKLPQWLWWTGGAVWATLCIMCWIMIALTRNPGFSIVVQGAPFGSEVSIDNVRHGVSWVDGTLRIFCLKPGNRFVKVSCEGFNEFKASVTGRDGEVQTVIAQLNPADSYPLEIDHHGGMVFVPAGEFIMGDDNHQPNEKPAYRLTLEDFYIDKYEVTNAQYKAFCDATGRQFPANPWWNKKYFQENPNLPVVGVTWEDARAYADWAGKRLPTEFEWEKAASWDPKTNTKRLWPWGNSMESGRATVESSNPIVVGSLPSGASPYGAQDLAGNVAEWTDSFYLPYPNNQQPDPEFGNKNRVVRGGSFHGPGEDARTSRRMFHSPEFNRSEKEEKSWLIGFRCAISANDSRLIPVLKKATTKP